MEALVPMDIQDPDDLKCIFGFYSLKELEFINHYIDICLLKLFTQTYIKKELKLVPYL